MLTRSVWCGWWSKIGKAAVRRRDRLAHSAPVSADVLEPRTLLSALVVTTANDELDSDLSDPGDLSLREAVAIANDRPGFDAITFDSALDNIPFFLNRGQLSITDTLHMVGNGPTQTRISQEQFVRVIDITESAGDVTFESLTVMSGYISQVGELGGGIHSVSAGRLTLLNSLVTNNFEGGIASINGPVTILNSTIAGNSADVRGGGIYAVNGDVTITNSTISQNGVFTGVFGDTSAGGSAVFAEYGNVTITNSTIARNVVYDLYEGGAVKTVHGSLRIANSIVAGNYAGGNLGVRPLSDIEFLGEGAAATFSATHSLIGAAVGTSLVPTTQETPDSNGNFVGFDPVLGELTYTGGVLVLTHALPEGSPAINSGDNSLAVDPDGNPLLYDERGPGFARIIGGTVDMGALESDFLPEAPAFPREETLEGYYFDGNGLAKVLSNGNELTIIDSSGNVSHTTLPDQTLRVTAFSASSLPTPISFDPSTGELTFSDGTVWSKVVNLAGRWLNASAQETGVRQLGADLTFTNVLGQSASGRFLSATQIIATDWGNLIGTLTNGGQRIEWSNGKVWDLIPDLEANWSNQSQLPTRVEQLGSQLVFVNRLGQTSSGRFLDATHVVASDWGSLVGTLTNGTIEWANGSVWTQLPPVSTNPDLAGLWDVAGKDTRVLQSGQTLTFVNRLGGISGGHFLTGTTVVATDWNVQGTISGDLLLWSNGTVWTRLPKLGGAWIDQAGQESGINQLERALTLTDATGHVTHGTLVSPIRVTESGSQRVGSLAGNLLAWSDGKAWSQIADLRGSWATVSGGAPTFVAQSGLSLLMISDTGVVGRGRFINGKVASMVFDGAPTVAVNVEVPGTSSLSFANGWLWQRPTTGALDDVFSDPNLWPFA